MFNAKNQASMIYRNIGRAIDNGDIKTPEQVEQEIRNVCDALENKTKELVDRVVKHRTRTYNKLLITNKRT